MNDETARLANYRRVMELPIDYAEPVPRSDEAMGMAGWALIAVISACGGVVGAFLLWSIWPLIVAAF